MATIDKFKRYQKNLRIDDLYPYKDDGFCRCGCGQLINKPKRIWASADCVSRALHNYFVVKGDITSIRILVNRRDNGICAKCGIKKDKWEADHIIEIRDGGGGCSLDNFQTLCTDCHKKKTYRR